MAKVTVDVPDSMMPDIRRIAAERGDTPENLLFLWCLDGMREGREVPAGMGEANWDDDGDAGGATP